MNWYILHGGIKVEKAYGFSKTSYIIKWMYQNFPGTSRLLMNIFWTLHWFSLLFWVILLITINDMKFTINDMKWINCFLPVVWHWGGTDGCAFRPNRGKMCFTYPCFKFCSHSLYFRCYLPRERHPLLPTPVLWHIIHCMPEYVCSMSFVSRNPCCGISCSSQLFSFPAQFLALMVAELKSSFRFGSQQSRYCCA